MRADPVSHETMRLIYADVDEALRRLACMRIDGAYEAREEFESQVWPVFMKGYDSLVTLSDRKDIRDVRSLHEGVIKANGPRDLMHCVHDGLKALGAHLNANASLFDFTQTDDESLAARYSIYDAQYVCSDKMTSLVWDHLGRMVKDYNDGKLKDLVESPEDRRYRAKVGPYTLEILGMDKPQAQSRPLAPEPAEAEATDDVQPSC